MQAKIWNFAKRVNSTKLPPADAPWEPDVNLKAGTSMETPTILLGSPRAWDEISSYNYMQLSSGDYYFIDEWVSVRGDLWEAHCIRDLMATYKDAIMATSAFVEYDTTGNTWIPDTRLSTNVNSSLLSNSGNLSLPFSTIGTFIVSVTGQSGGVGYYTTSASYLSRLLNSVRDWSDIEITSETGIEALVLAFCTFATKLLSSGNAPQNIRGCIWIPFIVQGDELKSIYLGTYDTGLNGLFITEPVQSGVTTLNIPWQASDWRQYAGCHNFELYLPFCGVVGIDAGQLAGHTSINVRYALDKRTGDLQYVVSVDNGYVIGSYSATSGVTIPIGVSSYNPVSQIGSISSSVAQIMSGNVAGSIGSIAQTAQNVLVPNTTCIGTQSSGAASGISDNSQIALYSQFHNTNVAPSSVSEAIGTPAMSVKAISSLTGFVKTRGASVAANAGMAELERINSIMDGGFYVE